VSQSGNVQFNSEKLRKGVKPIVAIKFDTYDGSAHKYYASKTIVLDNNSYIMRCKSLPKIHRSIKYAGGISSIGNVSVTLLNQDKETDFLRTTGLGYIMGNALVALIFNDGTTPLWAERLEMFTGKVDDITNISEDGFTFSIFDNDKVKDTIIGTLIDSTNYSSAPAESIGNVIPVIHGGHLFDSIKSTTPADINFKYENNMVECIKISSNKYMVGKSTLNEINTDDIWLYDTQTGRYLNLDPSHVTINNPDGDGYCSVTISIGQELTLYDWWFPSSAANLVTNDHDWSDPENCADNDIDTFATLNATFTTSATPDSACLRLTFPDYDMDGFDYISGIEMFYRGNYTLMNGDDTDITYYLAGSGIDVTSLLNLKGITLLSTIYDVGSSALQSTKHGIELQDGDGSDTYKLNYKGSETANISESASKATIEAAIEGLSEFNAVNILGDTDAYWIEYKGTSLGKDIDIPEAIDKTDSLNVTISVVREGKQETKDLVSAYLELRVDQPVSALTPNVYIKCHEVYKKIKLVFDAGYKLDTSRFKLFVSCKGYEYGTWIDGRSTSETDPNTGAVFSASHPDDDGAGDLVENPVGCIESVAKELLGLNPECLNENTFATHAKWDVTGDWDDSGGNATINDSISASMNGNLTQTAANRLLAGENGKSYILKYTCTATVAPNGDFALTITSAFAAETTTLPFTTGIHYVEFKTAAGASIADFVINATETSATQGNISLDNIYLFRNDIEMDSFNIAADARDGWKFSFAILKQIEATKLLDRMTYEASCWLYWNYANRLEIKAFDETANFTESGSATAISQDIFIHHPDIIALDFDDTADTSRIDFTAASEHQITGDLTFECWIYFNDFSSGNQMIVCCEGDDANEASNRLFYLYKNDANDTVFTFSQEHGANVAESITLTLSSSLSVETWYHLTFNRITAVPITALTIRDINSVTIASASTDYTDGDPTGGTNSYLSLGINRTGASPLDGKMKEARLWNDYRGATEIKDNLYKILTGNEANLVGYWRLDEGALTTVYDITTYENNGTIGAGCTWSTGSTYPDLGYYAQHLIKENSFKLSLLPTASLANDLTVNYYKNNQSNEYQKTSNTTDSTSIADYGTHEYQENLDYISDETTAEALRDDLLYKKKQKWYKAQFTTWTNAANKLEGDVINIRYPILDNGIMTSANMKLARWQIIDIEPDMNSQEITITAIILEIP